MPPFDARYPYKNFSISLNISKYPAVDIILHDIPRGKN